jgi:hypothetical protein
LNYKKGIFRIWLIAAVCWIGYTLLIKSDDVGDTFNYLFRKQQMIEDEKFSIRNSIKYVEKEGNELRSQPKYNGADYWRKYAQSKQIEDNLKEKARLEETLNSPIIIPKPRWEWILDITILPILLPALMFAIWWILSKIFIWIKKGFVGNN